MPNGAYPGLTLSQKPVQVQKLIMTPQLQAAIRLLAMPRMEVAGAVQKELMENPLLEDAGPMPDTDPYPAGKRGSGDGIGDHRDFETYTSRPETLAEHILSQARVSFSDTARRSVAATIAGSLDRNGYLPVSTEEIAGLCDVPVATVEEVLAVMRSFSPAGVCARDLRECLLIQVRQCRPEDAAAALIVSDHLHDLEIRNYRRISKKTGFSTTKIFEVLESIRKLEPKPGRIFYDTVSRYIEPDLYVIRREDDFKVLLNQRGMSGLKVSDRYYRLLKTWRHAGLTERAYLQEKLKSARWFIQSLQQRQQTILKVMETIVARQLPFFELGPAHLKPMRLKDVAARIDVVESTVSRAVSDKYVQTPHGLFPLKSFFSTGVPVGNGPPVSSNVVRDRIKEIIAEEDKQKPLSDDGIVTLLRASGFTIARRTVAKYRDQLGILSSNRRKVVI